MTKNKIEGVKPFNEFWFKSCYYHQLISGLSCFGVDKDAVFGNYFAFAKSGFQTDCEGILTEKRFEREFGYKNTGCNIDKNSLAKRIDKGQPLIVGVDNYYLKEREDLYGIAHGVHFILVYGYDFERHEVNIVEHEYRNSCVFAEKTMPLEELLLANKMYRKMARTKKTTCRALSFRKHSGVENKNIFEYLSKERLFESRKNAEKNLGELKLIFEGDENFINDNKEKFIKYFQDIKLSYSCLSKMGFIKSDEEKLLETNRVLSGYSVILSVLWKMRAQKDFGFAARNKDGVFGKINETKEAESKVYDFLEELCR